MTDFTYIDTREGWLFLAGVLVAYSRKIVGWSMSEKHDAELVRIGTSYGIASEAARS